MAISKMAKTEVRIEIKLDTRLHKVVLWILEHMTIDFVTKTPLWYPWRKQIMEWLSTGEPFPLVRYKTEFGKKWRWLKSKTILAGCRMNKE